jgi:hypothetical protein
MAQRSPLTSPFQSPFENATFYSESSSEVSDDSMPGAARGITRVVGFESSKRSFTSQTSMPTIGRDLSCELGERLARKGSLTQQLEMEKKRAPLPKLPKINIGRATSLNCRQLAWADELARGAPRLHSQAAPRRPAPSRGAAAGPVLVRTGAATIASGSGDGVAPGTGTGTGNTPGTGTGTLPSSNALSRASSASIDIPNLR